MYQPTPYWVHTSIQVAPVYVYEGNIECNTTRYLQSYVYMTLRVLGGQAHLTFNVI